MRVDLVLQTLQTKIDSLQQDLDVLESLGAVLLGSSGSYSSEVRRTVEASREKAGREVQIYTRLMETLVAADNKLDRLHGLVKDFEALTGKSTAAAKADVERILEEIKSVEATIEVLTGFVNAII